MYKFLTKNGQLLAFGVGLAIVVLFYVFAFGGMEDFMAVAEAERPLSQEGNIFLFGIQAAVFLTIAALVVWILFGLFHTATDPKGALKGIVGLVVLAVIGFVLYSSADPTAGGAVMADTMTEFNVDNGTSKFITAAITTSLVLLGLAILAFVLTSILRIFR